MENQVRRETVEAECLECRIGRTEPLVEGVADQVGKSRIKFVIFDFGGVFVRDGLSTARKVYSERTGVDIDKLWRNDLKPTWKRWEKGEISEEEFYSALTKAIGSDRFDLADFKSMFWTAMRRDEEMVALIKRLRKGGYTTALLTNNTKEWVEQYDRQDPFDQYFDAVVSSHEVAVIKPDLAIYEITMQRLGAKPEECVFIDDKERNLAAAMSLGMKAIRCTTGGAQVEGELEGLLKERDQ